MRIKKIHLGQFRNLSSASVELGHGRNILIGQNAQGKSNFLEAIELLATGKSSRADSDFDLIAWGAKEMHAELVLEGGRGEEILSFALRQPAASCVAEKGGQKTQLSCRGSRVERTVKVNELTQPSAAGLIGRLIVVSFKSQDLNLLRGGPKFRRDWIDSLILKLRPSFQEVFSSYQKTIAQRNKLLKTLFEKGKLTVSDQDQLLVWDKQLARFGSRIIKTRLTLLSDLLPLAQDQQEKLSSQREHLSLRYVFRAPAERSASLEQVEEPDADGSTESPLSTGPLCAEKLAAMEELDLARTLLKELKDHRFEELRRRQSLIGPHRDDIVFCLNETDAASFASQGQQRSIVLSLKLAELNCIQEKLNDLPVLLLDDVLAELDTARQAQLLLAVEANMQTIITTTHVSGFDPIWLKDARIFTVCQGNINADKSAPASHL